MPRAFALRTTSAAEKASKCSHRSNHTSMLDYAPSQAATNPPSLSACAVPTINAIAGQRPTTDADGGLSNDREGGLFNQGLQQARPFVPLAAAESTMSAGEKASTRSCRSGPIILVRPAPSKAATSPPSLSAFARHITNATVGRATGIRGSRSNGQHRDDDGQKPGTHR